MFDNNPRVGCLICDKCGRKVVKDCYKLPNGWISLRKQSKIWSRDDEKGLCPDCGKLIFNIINGAGNGNS